MKTATQKTQAKLPVFYASVNNVSPEAGSITYFGDDISTRLADKGSNFSNTEFQPQCRCESTIGREPRGKDFILGNLRCDITERSDDPSSYHKTE